MSSFPLTFFIYNKIYLNYLVGDIKFKFHITVYLYPL